MYPAATHTSFHERQPSDRSYSCALSFPFLLQFQYHILRSKEKGNVEGAASKFDFRAEQVQELAQPLWVSGPRRRGDQVSVRKGGIDAHGRWFSTCGSHVGEDRRVGGASAILQDAGSRQELGAMADGRDRLTCLEEVPDDSQHVFVQPQVLRRSSAWDYQRVVILGNDGRECCIQRESMPWLFAVRLVAFKIMDRRLHPFAGVFARTNCMNFVAHHGQCLKRHHRLVILDKVADQHQYLFGCHGIAPSGL